MYVKDFREISFEVTYGRAAEQVALNNFQYLPFSFAAWDNPIMMHYDIAIEGKDW